MKSLATRFGLELNWYGGSFGRCCRMVQIPLLLALRLLFQVSSSSPLSDASSSSPNITSAKTRITFTRESGGESGQESERWGVLAWCNSLGSFIPHKKSFPFPLNLPRMSPGISLDLNLLCLSPLLTPFSPSLGLSQKALRGISVEKIKVCWREWRFSGVGSCAEAPSSARSLLPSCPYWNFSKLVDSLWVGI